MEKALAAIRRAITDEKGGEETQSWNLSEEGTEAGSLSRKATAAVGSAFHSLKETAKKHEPTLEDVVRETLRPMLKS